jgi:hypothetical protein
MKPGVKTYKQSSADAKVSPRRRVFAHSLRARQRRPGAETQENFFSKSCETESPLRHSASSSACLDFRPPGHLDLLV